jgi:hypothetical protein
MILKVPSTISKVSTTADGGLRLNVDTQELRSEDNAILMGLYNKLGVFIFAEADINQEDLVDLPEVKVDKGQKTPSQVLRNRIFIFWKEKKLGGDFDMFYRRELERLGQAYLEKI